MISAKQLIDALYDAGVSREERIYINYLSANLGYFEVSFNGAKMTAVIDTNKNQVVRVGLEYGSWTYNYTDPTVRDQVMYAAVPYSNTAALLNEQELFEVIRNPQITYVIRDSQGCSVIYDKTSDPIKEDFVAECEEKTSGDYETLEVTFDRDELLEYMLQAHELDITFNQFVELAFRKAIADAKSKEQCDVNN